ncbi:aldo/keto reductase [Gordonia sp. NPDC127522]|uniref:aldo/keto reductase n=1 Tax=Gordonia sp. NPDC127522 TaxID=3345390 RepID=UPI0036379C19
MTELDDYRTLGRTGLRVSSLALGTMTFDDGTSGTAPEDAFELLDCYLDFGGNFLDTANQYNGGASETTLGQYFSARPGRRDRVVLATKFGSSLSPDDPNAGGAGRKAIHTQVEASLRRLNSDYVDVLWMHHWDRNTPLEETVATLDSLVRAGKIRSFGVSNTPAWWTAQASTTSRFQGWEPPAGIQVEYSLMRRSAEGEQFSVARELGLGVTTWSPLASGVLSGKYTRGSETVTDSRRAVFAGAQLTEKDYDLLDVVARIADELGTTSAGVALAWVRQQDVVTSVLVGARTVGQLRDNLASAQVTLSDHQLEELSRLSRPELDYPYPFLNDFSVSYQQGNTTVNGRRSTAFGFGYLG